MSCACRSAVTQYAALLVMTMFILKSAAAQTVQPLLEPCSGEACGKFTISTNSDWTGDVYCSINYIWYQDQILFDHDQCWCANSVYCGTGEYAQVWFNNDWYTISQIGVRACFWDIPEYVKTFKVGYHDGSGWKFIGGSTYESATLYTSSSTCSRVDLQSSCTDGTPNDIPATSCKGIRLYPMSAHQSCSTNMEIYGYPISSPTSEPTLSPTVEPTKVPTNGPTDIPSASPTSDPSIEPTTEMPSTSPSQRPTGSPIVPLIAVIETTTDTAASTSAPPPTTSMPSLEPDAATADSIKVNAVTVGMGSACGGVFLCCVCVCALIYCPRPRKPNNHEKQIVIVVQQQQQQQAPQPGAQHIAKAQEIEILRPAVSNAPKLAIDEEETDEDEEKGEEERKNDSVALEIDDGANKKPEGIRASVAVEDAGVTDSDSDSEHAQMYGSQHNEQQSTVGATPMTAGAMPGAHSHISDDSDQPRTGGDAEKQIVSTIFM